METYVGTAGNAVLLAQEGTGLYQALNQGIQAAIDNPEVTHIGMLHSDDQLIPEAFEQYLSQISDNPAPMFYSDIQFHDASGKTVRKWQSSAFSRFKLNTGWMPPHTSVVVKKEVYIQSGLYNPDFGTAADYDWLVRVLGVYGADSFYYADSTLSMLVGGASSASSKARLAANRMDGRVWARHSKLYSIAIRFLKPFRKIGQFF